MCYSVEALYSSLDAGRRLDNILEKFYVLHLYTGTASKITPNKIAFQSKVNANMYLVTFVLPVVCTCDLDLDPMTLIYKHGLHILKIHLYAKNKVSR